MPSSINKQLREMGKERHEVSLFLRFEDEDTKVYCMYCTSRKPLFMARGRVYMVMYGFNIPQGNVLVIPVGIQCPECGCVYMIHGVNA